jgi:FdhD protein
VTAVEGHQRFERPDKLVTEEPMEIRVHGPGQDAVALAVTMRTPGNDFELAVGFCLTEGIIAGADDLDTVAYCLAGEGTQEYNVVTVRSRRFADLEGRQRNFVANASCGVCGKATLDQLEQNWAPVGTGPVVPWSLLLRLVPRLRAAQVVFESTGALHAAASFTTTGDVVALREDVGRHNALDKLVGHAVLERTLPLADDILVVSGRVSFEVIQKAAAAGIPMVCAVSGPSSLAVDAAQRFGITLVGFLRDDRGNVYTRPERIDLDH